jgi:negative regulator of sigma E activity
MKRNLPNVIDHQFSARVMAEIENEPTILAPPSHKTPSLGKRVAGLAIAASVATIAVLGVQNMYQHDGMIDTQQMANVSGSDLQNAKTPIPQAYNRKDVQTVTQSFHQSPVPDLTSRQILPRIHRYLLDHAQVTPGAISQNTVPFSRLKKDQDAEKMANQKKSQTQDQIQR